MFQPELTLARTRLLTMLILTLKKSLKSEVLSNIDISDHYRIFTIIPICKNKIKKLENYKMRDIKNFDKEEFLITLENKLSNLLDNNTLSVNEQFKNLSLSLQT